MQVLSLIDQRTTSNGSPNLSRPYLEEAQSIAVDICKDAVWYQDMCNWIGQEHDHQGSSSPQLISTNLNGSLYDGTTGVALFLASVYKLWKEEIVCDTAKGAMRHALGATQMILESPHGLGYWNGALGTYLTSCQLATMLEAEEFLEIGLTGVENILTSPIHPDFEYDILGGAAGSITALLKHRHLCTRKIIDLLDKYLLELGARLLDSATTTARGTCWVSNHSPGPPLLGYGHGNSGCIHALLELYDFFGDQNYFDVALHTLEYENDFFDANEQNWPDLRSTPDDIEGQPKFMNAWCHGAVGIGLSRLRSYEITGNDVFLHDAKICLQKAEEQIDFKKVSACLCHGVSGNSDLLIEGTRVLQDQAFLKKAKTIGSEGIEKIAGKGDHWINGLQNKVSIPGLMNGLSGIGYFYLRLAEPNLFKSVLL